MRRSASPLLVFLLASWRCLIAPNDGSAQLGPTVILEDSVVLRETDKHYVGQPIGLQLAGDGSFLVTDGFSNSALRFGSDGTLLTVYGGQGGGPGEFGYILHAAFIKDDLVGPGKSA